MIIVVIFVFLLCWSPYVIVSLAMAFGSNISPLTLEITVLVAKSGVIYNPFIYAALNLRFRTAFFEMLHCDRITNRTKWGVKSRVLSGATGDSSGYLTSRASNCPSSRGLVERGGGSILQNLERRSSVEPEPQKPCGEQDQLLKIEHGICCRHHEQIPVELGESSNSDEAKVQDIGQTRPRKCPKYCNHCTTCLMTSRKCFNDAYTDGNDKECICTFKDMLLVKGERRRSRKSDPEDKGSKRRRGSTNSTTFEKQGRNRPGKVEIDFCQIRKSEKERALVSLTTINTKQNSVRGSSESKMERHEPLASCSCICQCCFEEEHEMSKIRRAAVVRERTSCSHKRRFLNEDKSCGSNRMKLDRDPCRQPKMNSSGRINDVVVDRKGPKGYALAHTIFGRRTSEGVQAELAKKTESFWRRPSLVIINNVSPIAFDQNI
jgi:hypothetical protein